METPRIPLTESERQSMSHGRVSLQPGRSDACFVNREVQIPIDLTLELNPNPRIFIAGLIFTDCIFLQMVNIGDFKSAGRVSFQNCEFQADVVLQSTGNVTIKEGCRFRKNLEIKSIGNIPELGGFSVDEELKICTTSYKTIISNINSEIQGQKLVIYANSAELQIVNCYFNRMYVFSQVPATRTVTANGCYAHRFNVTTPYDDCHIVLQESELGKISVGGPDKVKVSLKIGYCKKIKNLTLPLSKISQADVSWCEIQDLLIWQNSDKSDVLAVENCTINKLVFSRVRNDGLIALRGVIIPVGV